MVWINIYFLYVTGMNVLLGPFLLTMPELDAFYCFNSLMSFRCPRYCSPTLKGVHHACRLVWKLLYTFDETLFLHLRGKVDPQVFALAPCMTFMACLKPLDEVMRLWDLLFAIGIHFNVIFYTTHIILMREKLVSSSSSYR